MKTFCILQIYAIALVGYENALHVALEYICTYPTLGSWNDEN